MHRSKSDKRSKQNWTRSTGSMMVKCRSYLYFSKSIVEVLQIRIKNHSPLESFAGNIIAADDCTYVHATRSAVTRTSEPLLSTQLLYN